MMLLGLVIHTLAVYTVNHNPTPFALKDPYDSTLLANILVGMIHRFRMPIFFMVAGFFGALLFYEKGPRYMLVNRLKRIALPLVVFLLILREVITFCYAYTFTAFGLEKDPLQAAIWTLSSLNNYLPTRTHHLWFLYYLLMMSLVGFGLAKIRIPQQAQVWKKMGNWLFAHPIMRIVVPSLVTCLTFYAYGVDSIEGTIEITPSLKVLVFYGQFYLFGWWLYQQKDYLASFKQFAWISTLLGVALMGISWAYAWKMTLLGKQAVHAVEIWLLMFGLTGLFLRYGSGYSARMRYISDASYWIYLIHLPLAFLLPGLVVEWPIGPWGKIMVVLTAMTVICIVSYDWLVRSTAIGAFLNGRRYPRGLPKPKPQRIVFAPEPESVEAEPEPTPTPEPAPAHLPV